MTTESKALAPCPFCGRRAGNRGRDDYGLFAVFCYGCGAEIADDTIEKARVMWNTRAQPVVDEAMVPEAVQAEGDGFGMTHVAGDWIIPRPHGYRVVNAEFARGWNSARAALTAAHQKEG